jgi:hypothetical protein
VQGAVQKKETRRSRKAKKLAKGFVWRGALKIKGPDGREVVDPLSLPFQDPRQLVQHLLGSFLILAQTLLLSNDTINRVIEAL